MENNNDLLLNENYQKRKQLCKSLYEICLKPNDVFKFETTFLQIWNILEELNELEKRNYIRFIIVQYTFRVPVYLFFNK